ncbi:MAG: glucan biosynthesis protein G [Burkholderiales bacterium]|nr:glucan biosynthesis protein G [Burkholderiales bacterium]
MRRACFPALWLSLLGLLAPLPAAAFGWDEVAALAQQTAARPYAAPDIALPPALAALDYDGRRDIRYRPDRAVWRDAALPFQLQFFHRTGAHPEAVAIDTIEPDGRLRPLPYRAADYDFGGQRLDSSTWPDLGHAGFRVHYALNDPAYLDELIVFLGASYFRALGRDQQYGLSARGLAIDTVGGAGEEFPRFAHFWIERPAPDARTLTLYALLDSPRASGAYRFVVTPGEETVVTVQLQLYLRAAVAQLGIAPLTSMFLHGENQPSATDFRPEVHDSDGLMVAAAAGSGGATEWLWRPLVNPAAPLASSFAVTRLQGFGLMQRDRRFEAYEDTEARYERRPSAWVEPLGDWGPGRVELLQLHAGDETVDNIVACWVPAQMPAPGQPMALSYRLHWQGQAMQRPPAGWTVQSRRGRGWAPLAPGELQFMVDFDGPALRALPAGTAVQAEASAPANGRVVDARAWPLPTGGWRLQLRVQRLDPALPVELRAYLRRDQAALTETWVALVPPDPAPAHE